MPIRTPWPTAKEVAAKVREDNLRLAEEAKKRKSATKKVRLAGLVVLLAVVVFVYLATH